MIRDLTPDERWLLQILLAVDVVPLAPCVAKPFEQLHLRGLARCERGGIAATPAAKNDNHEEKQTG